MMLQTTLRAASRSLRNTERVLDGRPAFDGVEVFSMLAEAAELVEDAGLPERGSDAVTVGGLARVLRGLDLLPARKRPLPRKVEPEPVEPEPEPVEPEPEPVEVNPPADSRFAYSDSDLLGVLSTEPRRATAVARQLGVTDSGAVTRRCKATDGVEVLPTRPGRPTMVRLAPDEPDDPVPAGHRPCIGCGRVLPLTEEHFQPKPRCVAGLTPNCRECLAAQRREWYRRRTDSDRI